MKRWDIINKIIAKYGITSYLEIGVHNRDNFNKINCQLKECVDPGFDADYRMTSDMFFSGGYGIYNYGLIFIDGLHTADQTYKDINNSLLRLSATGFIVVHDCNPETEWHARPPDKYERGNEWNGTTYQGFIKFKALHPEYMCFTVDCDYGCGVITKNVSDIGYVTWDEFNANRVDLLSLIDVNKFDDYLDGNI